MGIPENIQRLRQVHELTQDELGKIAGVTGKAVWTWERGTATPRMKQFQRMADHFGYPKTVLIDDDGMDRIDPITKKLRRPPAAIGAAASDSSVPVYARIAAGKPVEAMPVEDSYWLPPNVLAAHPHCFFLRVEGESMNRVLPNGALALVDPDAEVNSGDVAVVNINGYDATIKRVLRGANSIVLSPDSRDAAFTDTVFDYSKPGADTVTVIGRVVWQVVPYGERI